MTLAAAQLHERAASNVQVQMTPGVAMQVALAVTHVQVNDTPGATRDGCTHQRFSGRGQVGAHAC